MRVLVACEYSGIVRDAFIKRGHDAISCDLLPTESPGPHHQGDVRDILDDGFDLMIAHPPCNHLASSGAQYWPEKQADGRQQKAIEFVLGLFGCDIPRIAIENPVGLLSTVWRKPDQIIQPYQFGDPYRKKTCLWIKGLPLLKPTNIVEPSANWSSGSYRCGPRKDGTRYKSPLPCKHRNSKKRSLSFAGIADAMAEQWGGVVTKSKEVTN